MPSPVASPAKACILLADDSQLVRNAIKNLLADLNPTWETCEAENGADALEKTLALNPDVAMLDLNLPDIRGETLAQQIRQLSPITKIVLCSLSDATVLAQIALHAGADAFISKTAPIEEFYATLTALIAAPSESR